MSFVVRDLSLEEIQNTKMYDRLASLTYQSGLMKAKLRMMCGVQSLGIPKGKPALGEHVKWKKIMRDGSVFDCDYVRRVVIAEGVRGGVLGWATIEYYACFFVDRRYRKRGVGRALIEEALDSHDDVQFYVPALEIARKITNERLNGDLKCQTEKQ